MSIQQFDAWLDGNGPVAVTVLEELEPVMGRGSVFFPPTFAPPKGSDESPSYVIDETSDGRVALVDSVGAQANRIEPIFKRAPYSELVPKASVKIGSKDIDLLDAGHRAADAVIRFSDKWKDIRACFMEIRERSNVSSLARVAPTSILFGVWDSRDTQVKLPRLIGSTIRAYKVDKLTRAAQFFAATEKEDIEGLAEQDFLSNVGLDDAPAGRTAGGVISRGGIRRETILNLVALRSLQGGSDEETAKVHRYVLGLGLVALFAPYAKFLREGCLLVPTEGKAAQVSLIDRTGKRDTLDLNETVVLPYAKEAAAQFGVGPSWTAVFDKDVVKSAATAKKEAKPKKSAK
ncbi:MAG: type I-U CRISPR-associated RAMP protein Csb1/Cas7u [Acidobacteriota bacterium]|nr:type I-U CRISPR-associated RAMP protein Csb1/Cas7u [Acidobacteriota bacterium]